MRRARPILLRGQYLSKQWMLCVRHVRGGRRRVPSIARQLQRGLVPGWRLRRSGQALLHHEHEQYDRHGVHRDWNQVLVRRLRHLWQQRGRYLLPDHRDLQQLQHVHLPRQWPGLQRHGVLVVWSAGQPVLRQ